MGDAFKLVGLLFVHSIPTIIFVIILLVILERLFFRPIAGVMKKRAEETVGAMSRARTQMGEAGAKSQQYESALLAARTDVYTQRQVEHALALSEHEAALRSVRQRSEELVKEAQATIAGEVGATRQQLSASCQQLAREIADKILGGGAEA
ncbi:MAG: ATP synthase F0 subunit B [Terriglobia bacterium]